LLSVVNGPFLPSRAWALFSVASDQVGAVDLSLFAGELLEGVVLDFSSPSPVPISQEEAYLSLYSST